MKLFTFPLALLAASLLASAQNTLPWEATDLGPFHSGCFKLKVAGADQVTAKGIAIKVGGAEAKATILFDPELLRWTAAWTGGFIKFPAGRGGLEGQIKPAGTVLFTTGYAPGWAEKEIGDDPRPQHQGHLGAQGAKWRGLYTHGEQVVLSYTVNGNTPVLELPSAEQREGKLVFIRTLTVGASNGTAILVANIPGSTPVLDGSSATLSFNAPDGPRAFKAQLTGAPSGSKFEVQKDGQLILRVPAIATGATFEIAMWSGPATELPRAITTLKAPADLAALTEGGPAHWGAPLETKGKLSDKDDAYVIDEIALPDENPFKSWLRLGGHDFFPDGTAAIVNISGDVWIVGGLDEKLEKVTWKRFATGLFQPLGCKIVDGKVYVLGRDQITRLHDLNNDGEADWYECFNNDCVVTDNYHEFALDLQTDRAGNFYYGKGSPWEPTVTSPHQGCIIRVSKDGTKFELFATGLRAPNGLSVGPQDQLTCSDNQGHWMPANRLNLVRQGGFYGMVPAAHRELTFKRADGSEFMANPSTDGARNEFKTRFWGTAEGPIPTEMDPPMVWMPQNVDNSPGGEVWVPGGSKWGPLAGQLLHLSYGHCVLYNVLQEQVGDLTQGAVVKLVGKFPSGIMRGRFSPTDGQLYVTGLNVWQSDAAKFGCLNRVRFTGKPIAQPTGIKTTKTGITLTFTGALDPATAIDKENWSVERWNYRWTGQYGSDNFSVADPTKRGKSANDVVAITEIKLSDDKKTLTLDLPDMGPAHQMRLKYSIKSGEGKELTNEIYHTIHRLADGAVAAK